MSAGENPKAPPMTAITAEELLMALWESLPTRSGIMFAEDKAAGVALIHASRAAQRERMTALEEENARLLEALQNMGGAFDTPVARRRANYDSFQEEAVRSMRDVLAALRAKEASKE